MIEISDEHYIGEGGFQKCYIHPNDGNLCVKISKPRIRKNARIEGELKYYSKIQKKDTTKFEYVFFARYFGEVETNLGKGYVYDLIKDEITQGISLTLADYLQMPNSPIPEKKLIEGLDRLKQQLIINKILVRDLTGKNICCKVLKDTSIELIVVDGVGHKDIIPLVDWIQFFTKMKIEHVFNTKKLRSMNDHRVFLKERELQLMKLESQLF